MPYCECGEPIPEGRKYCSPEHKARYHRHVPSTHFGIPRHTEKMLLPGVMGFLYGHMPSNENTQYRWSQGRMK